MDPFCSEDVLEKLVKKHGVAYSDILDAFANRRGAFLKDNREKHKTNPPTLWFIAETDFGVKLKVVFVPSADGPVVKTAYRANLEEIRIYAKVTGVCL